MHKQELYYYSDGCFAQEIVNGDRYVLDTL